MSGSWKANEIGFESLFNDAEIEILENSTPLNYDTVRKLVDNYFVLDEKELHEVVFTSINSIKWSEISGEDEVSCSRTNETR